MRASSTVNNKQHQTIDLDDYLPGVIPDQDKWLGWLIILSFAYMGFAQDWHATNTGETISVWMFGILPVLAMSVLVLLFFFDRCVRVGLTDAPLNYFEKGIMGRYAVMYCAFFIVVLSERMVPSPNDTPFNVWSYLMLFEMPLWGLLGFSFVNSQEKSEWLFGRMATIIAVGSVVSFALRIALGSEPIPRLLGPAGWPMRFFFIFGFCWFFVKVLDGSRDIKIILGLLASSLETIVAFHKPFIVACTFAILFILLLMAKRKKWFFRLASKFFIVSALIAGIFILIDYMTGGLYGTSLMEHFFTQYLKTDMSYTIKYDPSEALIYLSGGRTKMWLIALERFFDDPLLGSGLDQLVDVRGVLISLHNGYLEILLSFGILGCIPVAIGLFKWFRHLIPNALSNEPGAVSSITFLGYMLAIMIYNLGGTSRLYIASSFFMFFIFGAALRLAVASSSNSYLAEAETTANK